MSIWSIPVLAFWLMLPAYVANPTAVLFGGGVPVDLGAKMRDGKRLLGDGKTWSGTFGGIFCGFLLGLIIILLANAAEPGSEWGYGGFWPGVGLALLLPTGSLFGDMLGSFIKRRLNRERGARTPVLDQYDFVIGTFILLLIFFPGWTTWTYISGSNIIGLVTILVVTPALHRGVNIIGYKMGKKQEPW